MNFFGGPVGTVVKAQLIFVEVQLIFIYYYKGLNSFGGAVVYVPPPLIMPLTSVNNMERSDQLGSRG